MTTATYEASEMSEARALRDHLAAELDATKGTSEAVNQLVGRFIDAERKCRDMAAQSG